MRALAEYRATRCAGCGHDIRETTAQEGTHEWRASRRRCWGCDARIAAQDLAAQKKQVRPEAVLWSVQKVR